MQDAINYKRRCEMQRRCADGLCFSGDDSCGVLSCFVEVGDNPVRESSARTMSHRPWVTVVFH